MLVWPREHGAWAILAIPLITGAGVGLLHGNTPGVGVLGWDGGQHLSLLLFALAALMLFCMRTPLESLLGTTPMRAQTAAERHTVGLLLAALSLATGFVLYALVGRGENRGLLALGAVAGLLFLLQSLVRKLGRRGRMAAQMIGALGLTSTAAGAYYVVTRQFDSTALSLWFANWIFAGNQIHFVQLRIHGARLTNRAEKLVHGRLFLVGQILMMLALGFGWRFGGLPGLAILAFLPVFLRGALWFLSGPEPLRVHRLGVLELAHALTFGGLLIASFRLGS